MYNKCIIEFLERLTKANSAKSDIVIFAIKESLHLTHQRIVVLRNYDTKEENYSIRLYNCSGCQPIQVIRTQDFPSLRNFMITESTEAFSIVVDINVKLWQ